MAKRPARRVARKSPVRRTRVGYSAGRAARSTRARPARRSGSVQTVKIVLETSSLGQSNQDLSGGVRPADMQFGKKARF